MEGTSMVIVLILASLAALVAAVEIRGHRRRRRGVGTLPHPSEATPNPDGPDTRYARPVGLYSAP
jgi:hypothetical protein